MNLQQFQEQAPFKVRGLHGSDEIGDVCVFFEIPSHYRTIFIDYEKNGTQSYRLLFPNLLISMFIGTERHDSKGCNYYYIKMFHMLAFEGELTEETKLDVLSLPNQTNSGQFCLGDFVPVNSMSLVPFVLETISYFWQSNFETSQRDLSFMRSWESSGVYPSWYSYENIEKFLKAYCFPSKIVEAAFHENRLVEQN